MTEGIIQEVFNKSLCNNLECINCIELRTLQQELIEKIKQVCLDRHEKFRCANGHSGIDDMTKILIGDNNV